jgi:hypothetical protein
MSSVPCFLVFFYYLFDGFGGKLFTKLTTTKTALGSKKDNEKLKHNDVMQHGGLSGTKWSDSPMS